MCGVNSTLEGFRILGRMQITVKLLDLIGFLVSGSLERCIDCPKVSPCSFSDHDFVALNFSPDDCPRTRSGVWKFNSSLLNDATLNVNCPS